MDQFVKMAKVLASFVVSPNGAIVEMSCRLEHICTNDQAEYEALLFGLEILQSKDVHHVLALGDSLLIV